MRKLIAPVITAALVLAFGLQPSATAQSATMQATPSGSDLEAKARSFLTAAQTGQAEGLLAVLAPWRKSEAELYRARIIKRGHSGALQWESLEKQLKDMDPLNKLNVGSLGDYLALNEAQMFALSFGMYRAGADRQITQLLADEWFVVDRKIGLSEPTDRFESSDGIRGVMETGGRVVLESVEGGRLTVFCVTDGHEWFIVEGGFHKIGKGRMNVRMAMAGLSGGSSPMQRNQTSRARAAEGEQMLGSMKNRCKVAYVKMNSIPSKLTGAMNDGGCGVTEAELEGRYYRCRDAVYVNGNTCALVAEPLDESDPWLLFIVHMLNPAKDEIKHFDSKAEVDAAAEKVKNGEIPEAK